MKKLKQKYQKTSVLVKRVAFFTLSLYLVGCSEEVQNKTEADLPFIGQHDIAYADMDGYKKGDTIFHVVPDWELITEDSLLFSSSEIDDKIWIANFFFSHCPTICKPMNREMKKVIEELEEYRDSLSFLSFSIDTKRDTPSRLKEYRKEMDFNAKNWHFFTGNQDEIYDLAYYGFQVLAMESDSEPGGFIHSSNFVLVDKNKHIRGIYDSLTEEGRKKMIADIKILLYDK